MIRLRSKKTILVAVVLFSLGLIFSILSPTIQSQVSGFNLPVSISTTGNAWDGYIAFDLELESTFMGVGSNNNYFVVMATNGTVLAVRQSGTSYGAAWNIAPDILMFLGEPQVGGADTAPTYSTHFWNVKSGATQDFPNVVSEHDIQYDPINNTFLTLQQYLQQVGNNQYLIDRIVQVDANGNVLWAWNPFDHIPLSEASSFNETSTYNGQTAIDFSHANTLDWDYNNSIIYLNTRNTNTFYKINQTNGDLIWACGEFGNFTLLGENGQPLESINGLPPSLWYHCHTVEQISPNTFMLFNNDFKNNSNPSDCRSSLIEIALNETSMTARVIWSWQASTSIWNQYGGAIVHLPNGDFLGDFGTPTHQFPENKLPDGTWGFKDTGAVFVEVNPAGQVVKTFTFPAGWWVYRVETLTNPASISFAPTSVTVTTPTPTVNPGPVAGGTNSIRPTPTPPTPTPSLHNPTPTPSSTLASAIPSSTPLTHTTAGSQANSIIIISSVVIAIAAVALAVLYSMRKRINPQKANLP
jgi:hypothetical protein